MAMLAEPRRKVRYTVDPSGEDWARSGASSSGGTNGSGQFGQRMLKSMGWREGQGLGKDGQGAPEPIRVKHKNDQRGVGCTSAYAADSMPQSVDFASLLSQLNEAHGAVGADAAAASCHSNQAGDSHPAAIVSLEAKSRSSRARLHYHRFTRGKDVSAYDSQSLACIFGARGTPAAVVKNEASTAPAEAEAADKDADAACETVGFGFGAAAVSAAMKQSRSEICLTSAPQEQQQQQQQQKHGLQLVQSQTSLQDYFRAKMQARMLASRLPVATASGGGGGGGGGADEAGSSWTSESSCSAASTLSDEPAGDEAAPPAFGEAEEAEAAPPAAKQVRFSVSPKRRLAQPPSLSMAAPAADQHCHHDREAEEQDDAASIVVIDFALFPGSNWKRVLGYPHY